METSSPTKEVVTVVSPESNSKDEENKQKCAPTVPICVSNVDNIQTEDLPVQSVQNVQKSDESIEQSKVSSEDPTQMSTETAEVVPAAVDNVSENKNESLENDSIQTEKGTTASAASEIIQGNSASVQSHDGSESVPILQKTDEPMETGETVQSTTEADANVSKDVAMEELQSAPVPSEPVSQSNQNAEQPNETTAPVESSSEMVTENIIMEEPQSAAVATVASEAVSQSNQEAQQPNETVKASSESVTESVASVDTEVIDISEPPPEAQKQQEVVKAVTSGPSGGLSLLAEYDSGNDSDVCEVPSMQNYQNRVVEIDSDTESSSSSDDEEEDNEPIDVDLLSAVHVDDDEEETVRSSRSPRVKGEFHLDDLPPIHELQITVPEEECTELGKIQSIVEQLVIVNSLPGTVPLDLETVLFLDKGKKVLGEVFDVLGQVSDPLYCVRFNSNKDVKAKGIEVGQIVYVAPRTQHTQFVILANLMKDRGSDASWEYDVEPPERYLDYSDDEEERSARRTVRNRNRPMEGTDEAAKRSRPTDAPTSSGSRPYRGGYDGARMPHFPNSYRIAGNSWHSNYPQHYSNPQQPQYPQYRPPPRFYRPPARGMPHRQPGPHPGMVVNPYAMFPPPHLMQQPLFPPPTHQPPPPAPPGPHGGY